MVGNVAEWVADWYQSDYYSASSSPNPPGPKTGTRRVVRGGAWGTNLENIYATTRSGFPPNATSAGLGFRCAMDVRAEP
jgi:formylglycine-generating enzyme required for sulfatase activity